MVEKYWEGRKPTKCGKDNTVKTNGLGDNWFADKHGLNYENGEVSGVDCQEYQENKNGGKKIPNNLIEHSFKNLKCKDWETNKKRARDEGKYFQGDILAQGTKIYDKNKKEIAKYNIDDIIGKSCDKCRKMAWQKNMWGDEWLLENHRLEEVSGSIIHGDSTNHPINQTQNNQYLLTLQTIQSYFTSNNIHQITQQPNGDLLISFNQTNNDPTNQNNQTSPQIITEQQITDSSSNLDQEQKNMWQRFKDYLKSKGKSGINKQELEQEIKKIETTSEKSENKKTNPTNYTPWIIGGGIAILFILASLGIVKIRTRRRYYRRRRSRRY
ncbi:MAG: hypothetical protein I3273_04945 [Candidatus Moeniiplasma glomeromycotorum]|nr:hypothetical protein [Candidatus Moeniiplasma glomeromycotorum]MCE8167889.1 hypothetical protein [Candidatus Moeniiplasma glomeromycotorum]MCE8169439.1 hypothetical protein [Candidatus Moeniiplasma glomeromycotorum]